MSTEGTSAGLNPNESDLPGYGSTETVNPMNQQVMGAQSIATTTQGAGGASGEERRDPVVSLTWTVKLQAGLKTRDKGLESHQWGTA